MSTNSTKAQAVVDTTQNYVQESGSARESRMTQNQKNFDFYHLKQDFSHKLKNQSQEFLPRQSMAVEQIAQFLHQGIVDLGEFFSADPRPGVKNSLFTKDEARKIIADQLGKAGFYNFVQDSIKSGLLGSLMIAKVRGEMASVPHYFTDGDKLLRKSKKAWKLQLDLVRQEDYLPDPTAEKLYKIQRIYKDLWAVGDMVKAQPKLFDSAAFNMLEASVTGSDEDAEGSKKARETGQNPTSGGGFRKRVKLHECWGKILDSQSGKVLHDRVLWVVANDQHLIMPPIPYPNWANEDPFVEAPLRRVPWSVWHQALMDAPTFLNQAMNEIFNLTIDGGINSVFGIKQLREYWLEDPSQVNDGITPGTTLGVNQSCPPDGKVLERVDTGGLNSEGMQAFELASREFNSSALTNDLRLGGLPQHKVSATEVVESSQSITSVFTGVGKSLETDFIEKIIEKSWNLSMQNYDKIDENDLRSILGEKRAEELEKVKGKDRFTKTVNGHAFKVFGVSQTLNKVRDFKKLTGMLQTISSSGTLQEAFVQKYDFSKLLGKLLEALDVDLDSIKLDKADQEMNEMGGVQGEGAPAPEGPDLQSQIPQASTGSGSDAPGLSQAEFPQGG